MNRSTDPAKPARSAVAYRLWVGAGVLLLAGVLALIWFATPLRDYAGVDELAEAADALEHMPLSPLIVIAVYVVGVVCLVPLALLVAATGVIYGSWPGVAYAFAGALLSAMVTYYIGRAVGGRNLRRLAGARVDDLSRKVARQGVKAMFAVRLVPVAPFAVVNLVAGAAHIRVRDFFLGTVLGMSPGILIKVVFADQIARAAETSDFTSVIELAVAALAIILLGWMLRRVYARRNGTVLDDDEDAQGDARERPGRAPE